MKTLIFLITIIAATSLVSAGEIIPIWNKTIEGTVHDMEFLRGQEEVIMLVGEGPNGLIQKRNSQTGELINSRPQTLSSISRLALTPDSTKFLLLSGSIIRQIDTDEDFSVLNQFFIPQESDSILLYFTSIAVDPVRPIAYLTTRGWIQDSAQYADKYKVTSYNYETGEKLKDYTEYGGEEYTVIKVSHEGRYLAAMNDGDTYLKLWDLEQYELIINEPLFDASSESRSEARDLYFPLNENNIIYLSGNFTEKVNQEDKGGGTYRFNLHDNTRYLLLPNEVYGSDKLLFIDNESRIINTSNKRIGVINKNTNKLEWYGKPPENVYSSIVLYNERYDYFLGSSGINNLTLFQYDRETSVINNYEEEIVISPNPTFNSISITIDCKEQFIDYSIYNIDSALMANEVKINQESSFSHDFSPYPSGIYFLTFICNKQQKVYKIVKEG